MNGMILRRSWIVVAGLAWLGIASTTEGQSVPLRVNTHFQFRVEISTRPNQPAPTAPWYSYFPADPRLVPQPHATPYPPWPAPFPPPTPSFDNPKDGMKKWAPPAPTPGPKLTQAWPTYYRQQAEMQPVGFVPMHVPSYWYQGR